MTRVQALPGLDARVGRRHALHGEACDWPEKNCYSDLWVELLDALELDPYAMLGHTIRVDFLGDQWTFFKPPLSELRDLYGVDVQELTVWRPLLDHALEHLSAGRLICTEADAWWLPDTAGTDYRRKHTKTTIAIAEVDTAQERVGYFHNAGYFHAEGEDYRRLFRVGEPHDDAFMPFYAELVCVDRRVRRPRRLLADDALDLLKLHHAWRPASNPFRRFAARLRQDVPRLQAAGLQEYHQWAFATLRQAGAAFELAAAHVDWLAGAGRKGLAPAADAFRAISHANKSLILKGARAVHTRKPFDADEAVAGMAHAWDDAMRVLDDCLVPRVA